MAKTVPQETTDSSRVDAVMEQIAQPLSSECRELLEGIVKARLGESSPEMGHLSPWPQASDVDATEGLTELLEAGWLELREDGGRLESQLTLSTGTLIPGWRMEAVALGRPDRALPGLQLVSPTDGLDTLLLSSQQRSLLERFRAMKEPWALILLGGPGSGKTTVTHALAHAMGRRVLSARPSSLFDPRRGLHQNLAILGSLVQDLGAVLLLEPMEEFFPRSTTANSTDSRWYPLLDSLPGPVICTSSDPGMAHPSLGQACHAMISLAPPRGQNKVDMWSRVLQGVPLEEGLDLEKVVRRFDLTPGAIQKAVAVARAACEVGAVSEEELMGGALLQVRHKLDTLADQVTARLDSTDLVLDDTTAATVKDIIDAARVREQVFDDWGFGGRTSRGRGLSMLFDGEPGTGKTLSAEVLSAELGLPLYRVSMANIMSKWVGETEKNLQRIFHEARGSRTILLFDEADALFSQRVDVKGANDRFANMEVNVLLQLMESHDGICILTTNLKKGIDKAFERRLSFKVHFPFPEPDLRERLWEHHLPEEAPVAEDVDTYILAHSFELSGGSIRNAVVRAAYRAAADNRSICQDDLCEGAKAECVAAGKLYRIISDDE
ncbi:MAG: hypothetical protein CMH54_10425 [Myxococcales bacterium]|nr:hypothetical protein [Myxococcales bacterium]